MTVIIYSNIADNAQTTLWAILRNDTTLKSLTKNVLDQIPANLYQGVGFPYVITHSPTNSEKRLTLKKRLIKVTFPIEILDKKEANIRRVSDAVRNAIRSNESITELAGLKVEILESSAIVPKEIEDTTIIYTYTMYISYEWFG